MLNFGTEEYRADMKRLADEISTDFIRRWNAGLKDQMNGDDDGPWPDDYSIYGPPGKEPIPAVERIVWLLGGL